MYKLFLTVAFVGIFTYLSVYSPLAETANIDWSHIAGNK